MACENEITQGDSLAISASLNPSQDMTGWTCRVLVRESITATPDIDKTLSTISGDTFSVIGSLTPAETAALSEGVYLIVRVLSDGSNLSKEEVEELTVRATAAQI